MIHNSRHIFLRRRRYTDTNRENYTHTLNTNIFLYKKNDKRDKNYHRSSYKGNEIEIIRIRTILLI